MDKGMEKEQLEKRLAFLECIVGELMGACTLLRVKHNAKKPIHIDEADAYKDDGVALFQELKKKALT
jgi:hypothetical protein